MTKKHLHRQNIIACVWDFDKTLIPGYMQAPIFDAYGVDEEAFWSEVNALPGIYAARGTHVSKDTIYLNHLISFVKNGPMKGLTNKRLRELGSEMAFYPGLPHLFESLKSLPASRPDYRKHNIQLEHYIISTGLAEMIKGSAIAPHVDGIFGCEFIEAPLPPHYSHQDELPLEMEFEISQIGTIVDNTIKTRFIFEINKGGNKNPEIDVNASMDRSDRRVPIDRMIYVADRAMCRCSRSSRAMGARRSPSSTRTARPSSPRTTGSSMLVESTPTGRPTTGRPAPPRSGCGCMSGKSATPSSRNARRRWTRRSVAHPGTCTGMMNRTRQAILRSRRQRTNADSSTKNPLRE